jgi:hypothetical protein
VYPDLLSVLNVHINSHDKGSFYLSQSDSVAWVGGAGKGIQYTKSNLETNNPNVFEPLFHHSTIISQYGSGTYTR